MTSPIRLVRQLPKVPQWPTDNFIREGQIEVERWAKYMRDQNAGATEWYREYQEGLNRALNLPNFYVDRNGTDQTGIVTATTTKIQFTNVSSGNARDDWGYFDKTTNYRYTPLISGMYVFVAQARFVSTAVATSILTYINKNGAAISDGIWIATGITPITVPAFTMTRMDGKADYIEFAVSQNSGINRDLAGGVLETFAYGYKICD